MCPKCRVPMPGLAASTTGWAPQAQTLGLGPPPQAQTVCWVSNRHLQSSALTRSFASSCTGPWEPCGRPCVRGTRGTCERKKSQRNASSPGSLAEARKLLRRPDRPRPPAGPQTLTWDLRGQPAGQQASAQRPHLWEDTDCVSYNITRKMSPPHRAPQRLRAPPRDREPCGESPGQVGAAASPRVPEFQEKTTRGWSSPSVTHLAAGEPCVVRARAACRSLVPPVAESKPCPPAPHLQPAASDPAGRLPDAGVNGGLCGQNLISSSRKR
ncbi:PREDICTED: uncharacterized protein LOC102027022 [Chinchilla lanigera]|uniref:uncharacterized protein LOC102027022 n=1 Tax=Chinchilla lanigera TaxID=34839 RepID=UPI000698A3ED|nr:PREDICTED: uncharacterized protein LOC102027022 [Chinchilla lanigera]